MTNYKHILLKSLLIFPLLISISCLPGGEPVNQVLKGNRVIPDGVSRIYIDEISAPNISGNVTDSFKNSLRRQINSSDKISLTDSRPDSDMTLRVLIDEFYLEPVKFNPSGVVIEKKMRIVAYIYLKYTKTEEECLNDKKVESEVVYSEVNIPIMTEYKALTLLTDLLSDRIASVITTGWYLKNRKISFLLNK
ncbi:MAG: hypothetical protein FWG49_07145 [Leptospirales bacterium]|nr:hypothetical protein [Leptospirales bacterium]